MQNLKERTLRGGYARMCSQAANFLLRVGSLMVLARLLDPKDFGLVGMVTAFTGVLSLFRDFGLSAATVQRASVTEEQHSTLFWVNVLVGAILTVIALVLAPFVGTFYHEPRLVQVTRVVALGFLFNAAGIQHSASLQRQMRFTLLAVVDMVSLVLSTGLAIGAAKAGSRYWALVVMAVAMPFTSTIGLWLTTRWVPGRPRGHTGIRSMMRFGGTMTLNGVVVYIASNFEKVLLGRFWGAEAIGLYGRAYQLIRIPTDNLNGAIGEVAFSALSRVQDDPSRLRSYFLKGYSLVIALTVPATIACALFAEDLIVVLLGPKWKSAAIIFRLLSPTILVFAIANPLSWLLSSIGMVGRGLKMALVIAPLMIAGYVIGLPYGPKGVAISYSAVMVLWVFPLIAWSVHGTVLRFRDIVTLLFGPVSSSVVAALVSFGVRMLVVHSLTPLPRLAVETAILLTAYVAMLLLCTREKSFYRKAITGWRTSRPAEAKSLVSA